MGGPGHLARCGQDPFEEGAVEARVVRNDEVAAGDERTGGLDVDVLPAKRVVGQCGQRDSLGGEGPAGVLEIHLRLVVQDLGDAPVCSRCCSTVWARPVMDVIGGEHGDSAMAVLGVVPREERPAEVQFLILPWTIPILA